MDDVVTSTVANEVPEHPASEHDRRQDPATARPAVELHPWSDRVNGDARDPRISSPVPLSEGQIADLVSIRRQPLSEVSVPALGPANRVWEQAVVDQADAHG